MRLDAHFRLMAVLVLLFGIGTVLSAQSLFDRAVEEPEPAGTTAGTPRGTTTGRRGPAVEYELRVAARSTDTYDALAAVESDVTARISARPSPAVRTSAAVRLQRIDEAASSDVQNPIAAGTVELREFEISYHGAARIVRAARAVEAWGKVDALSPTDVVNTRTLAPAVVEPDETKQPRLLFGLAAHRGAWSGEVVWLPVSAYHAAPEGAGPAGADPPRAKIDHGAAARLRYDSSVLNAALVAHWGPSAQVGVLAELAGSESGGESGGVPVLRAAPHRAWTVGFNAESALYGTVGRVDAAFTAPQEWTEAATAPNLPAPALQAVFEVERRLRGRRNPHVSFLYAVTRVFDRVASASTGVDPEAQIQRFNNMIFDQMHDISQRIGGRVAAEIANATVVPALTAQYSPTSGEYIVRPTVVWDVADGLTVQIGATYADGPAGTRFGESGSRLSAAFVRAKVAW